MSYGLLLCVMGLHAVAGVLAFFDGKWLLGGLLLTFAVGDLIMAFMAK